MVANTRGTQGSFSAPPTVGPAEGTHSALESVTNPLLHIASQIKKTEPVGLERSDGCGSSPVPRDGFRRACGCAPLCARLRAREQKPKVSVPDAGRNRTHFRVQWGLKGAFTPLIRRMHGTCRLFYVFSKSAPGAPDRRDGSQTARWCRKFELSSKRP